MMTDLNVTLYPYISYVNVRRNGSRYIKAYINESGKRSMKYIYSTVREFIKRNIQAKFEDLINIDNL